NGARVATLLVVTPSGGDTTRLVGELPRENGRVVAVEPAVDGVGARDDVLDPGLVRLPDSGIGVEFVMILLTEPHHVLVHATKVVPVVDHHQDQLDVVPRRTVEHVVETW